MHGWRISFCQAFEHRQTVRAEILCVHLPPHGQRRAYDGQRLSAGVRPRPAHDFFFSTKAELLIERLSLFGTIKLDSFKPHSVRALQGLTKQSLGKAAPLELEPGQDHSNPCQSPAI